MSALIACSNCWYNPLQAGALGWHFGYCVEHRVVLRRPDETTCSLHIRKDLLFPSAQAEREHHGKVFGPGCALKVVKTRDEADSEIYRHQPEGPLNGDRVVSLVAEYGDLHSKIESLAQLRSTPGPRAETAMLSLARGYTSRCVTRGGRWTSGLHLVWWTRRRLEEDPAPSVALEDLRFQLPVSIKRQQELVQWSLAMLRLSFVSDIGFHGQAANDDIGKLASLAEDAAAGTETVSLRKLLSWIRKEALPRFDDVLGYPRYRELARGLHRDSDDHGSVAACP